MIHLDRPFHVDGAPPVSQVYGNDWIQEPYAYKYPDGSISYQPDASAVAGHWHNGVDYSIPCGTQLYAPNSGWVIAAGESVTGFGLRLILEHRIKGRPAYWTVFGHLSSIQVQEDKRVMRGRPIATSGGGNGDWRDGNSTGCHLHWSVYRLSDRHYVDPLPFLLFHAPALAASGGSGSRPL